MKEHKRKVITRLSAHSSLSVLNTELKKYFRYFVRCYPISKFLLLPTKR